MIATIKKDNLPEIRELLWRMVRETFPEVTFTDIWIRGRESWYGDEVVDIWSVYEGGWARSTRLSGTGSECASAMRCGSGGSRRRP